MLIIKKRRPLSYPCKQIKDFKSGTRNSSIRRKQVDQDKIISIAAMLADFASKNLRNSAHLLAMS